MVVIEFSATPIIYMHMKNDCKKKGELENGNHATGDIPYILVLRAFADFAFIFLSISREKFIFHGTIS